MDGRTEPFPARLFSFGGLAGFVGGVLGFFGGIFRLLGVFVYTFLVK